VFGASNQKLEQVRRLKFLGESRKADSVPSESGEMLFMRLRKLKH
jgi:hypothetical protein